MSDEKSITQKPGGAAEGRIGIRPHDPHAEEERRTHGVERTPCGRKKRLRGWLMRTRAGTGSAGSGANAASTASIASGMVSRPETSASVR